MKLFFVLAQTLYKLEMNLFSTIGRWISENESLLSGLVAMIVLAGFFLSPVGAGIRRFLRGNEGESKERAGISNVSPAGSGAERLTLKDLTAPSPHEIHFAQSDGVRIAFNERGSGPPNLVVAPGIISHLNIAGQLPVWRDTLQSLSQFARVITFDKRGQGLSDPTLLAPNLEERTRDIEAVLKAAGLERAILVGISEGGPMCMRLAYSHPDRVQGLVLIGTTARFAQCKDFPIGLPQRSLERIPQLWGTGALRDTFFPSISREQIDDNTYRAVERLIGSRTTIRQVVEMMIETDVRRLLPDINVPTLVIHFSGDLAIPIRLGRFVAENIPNAEFMEVNAVDHGDVSQSREAIERIRTFCEDIESGEHMNVETENR
jgi:pimeloyl-ACP methyl ester carboxylesterase